MRSLRTLFAGWDELPIEERRRVRGRLNHDFSGICGYCEQRCEPTNRDRSGKEESVDHFRPRSRFPGESLNWLNLVYSCRRCNQAKGDRWPTAGDADNRRLGRIRRYRQVDGYVCPNAVATQPPAEFFFSFDIELGEIVPDDNLADSEWSLAYRTIVDLDLNSIATGDDLPEQRRLQRDFLRETLRQVSEIRLREAIIAGFAQRSRPFSSFVAAYATATEY